MRPPPGSATEFRGSTLQSLHDDERPDDGRTRPPPQTNRLLAALDAPFMSDDDRTDAMYLAVLSREPGGDERDAVVEDARRVQNAGRTNNKPKATCCGRC